MNDIILGASVGGLAAFLVSMPAIITEVVRRGKVKNLPLVVDVKSFFDLRLSQLAAFATGLLLHILMGMVFGSTYPFVADKGWLDFVGQPYGPLTLLFFTGLVWLVFDFIFFPLFGFGWLGRKEGKTVWLEVLVSLLLIAFIFWLAVPVFQPVYF
ncbi:MAG: hypothetical protein WC702_04070 [Patescibacteria group bacterium]|jgi:hypothetical protein